jgi:hypothetical protein
MPIMQNCDRSQFRRNRCYQIVSFYVSVYRTIYSYKHEGMIMQIERIKGSSCETFFNVNGEILRLYVITGGTPALAFEDHSFSHKYPITDTRWTTSEFKNPSPATANCKKPRYTFQGMDTPDNEIQGPGVEVLPEGEDTVAQYLEQYVPLRNLRRDRYESLPFKEALVSRLFHDKEEYCYYHLKVDINDRYVSSALKVSNHSCGDPDSFEPKQKWWQEYNSVVQQLSSEIGKICPCYEELTESQFNRYREVLSRFNGN